MTKKELITIFANRDFKSFNVEIVPSNKKGFINVWLGLNGKVSLKIREEWEQYHKYASFAILNGIVTIRYNPKYTIIKDLAIKETLQIIENLPHE